jgi:hypothetical protein
MDDPANWTDDEVKAYLLGEQEPLECWCADETGGYGFVSKDGTLFACADDWEERAIRIVAYLTKIGARSMDDIIKTAAPLTWRPQID